MAGAGQENRGRCQVAHVAGIWLLVSMFAGLAGRVEAQPRAKPSQTMAEACTIQPLTLNPIFMAPAFPVPATTEDAGDDDEEEEDDEEDEEEDDSADDDETMAGMRLAGAADCIAIGGSVSAGIQISAPSSRGLHKLLLTPPDRVSFLPGSSIRLAASRLTAAGARLDAAFAINILPSTDPDAPGVTLTEAKVETGGWTFGHDYSRFNFWDGDSFLFGARIPARSALMLSRRIQLTESWSITAGAEDPRQQQPQPLLPGLRPAAGTTTPDAVGQIAFEGDALRLHVAGAVRQHTRGSRLDKKTWGVAVIGGAEWRFAALGGMNQLTAQAAWAHDAPGYLGTQLERATLGQIISADDTTTGHSLLLAYGRELSESVSANLYVSQLRLDLPKLGVTGGRAEISRGAANIVWSPLNGLRLGLEGGVSLSRLDLPGRAVGHLSGRQRTAILWIDRAF